MAYRLRADEPIDVGLRRCAVERLDHALDALREPPDPGEAIHTARKDIKKVRSLLRLARPDLGARTVREENDALRAASGYLAEARDAGALAGTVEDLATRFAGRLPHGTWDALADALGGDGSADDPAARERAVTILEDVRVRAESWALERCTWSTVLDGLDRSYRRGRTAGHDAVAAPSPDGMHAWRKRAKDLWYQERLVHDAWPAVMQAQASEAHLLTEILGDDHDLAELRRTLTERPTSVAQEAEVLALVDHARAEQLADARALGARIYAERPKAHRRRLRRYVHVLRATTPVG